MTQRVNHRTKKVLRNILIATYCLVWGCAVVAIAQVGNKPGLPKGIVLEIQGTRITAEELSNRLNLAPRLDQFRPDSIRREAIVASIIAETILAREAKREHLDTLSGVQTAMAEFEKEAVYEQWMNSEVSGKIQVSDNELQQAYHRFVEERIVGVAVFEDSASARDVAERIRMGESLSSITDANGEPVSRNKTIQYGEAVRQVEDVVYSLNKGQGTAPIRVDGRYYVFQLKESRPHPTYSQHDFEYWRPSVVKRVRGRKELDRFSEAMTSMMAKRGFTIDKRIYEYVLREVSRRIPFGNKELLRIPETVNREFAVIPDDIRSFFHEPFIRFQGGSQWTVGDFWEKLQFGPYLLNYQSPQDLTKDFSHLIRTMVLFEAIVREGYKHHLEKTPFVRSETRMWSNDLLAKLYERRFVDSVDVREPDIREYYNANKEEFANADQRKVLEIVVSDRELAIELIDRIRAGEEMKELAKRYSMTVSPGLDAGQEVIIQKHTGGNIGEIAFTLPPGGLYGPIELDSSKYAIIRLEEIIKEGYRPFEEVRQDIVTRVQNRKAQIACDRLLEKRAGSYRVRIDKRALCDVTVLKGTMAVRKSHFPNRFAVPMATPFDVHAFWFEHIWNEQ